MFIFIKELRLILRRFFSDQVTMIETIEKLSIFPVQSGSMRRKRFRRVFSRQLDVEKESLKSLELKKPIFIESQDAIKKDILSKGKKTNTNWKSLKLSDKSSKENHLNIKIKKSRLKTFINNFRNRVGSQSVTRKNPKSFNIAMNIFGPNKASKRKSNKIVNQREKIKPGTIKVETPKLRRHKFYVEKVLKERARNQSKSTRVIKRSLVIIKRTENHQKVMKIGHDDHSGLMSLTKYCGKMDSSTQAGSTSSKYPFQNIQQEVDDIFESKKSLKRRFKIKRRSKKRQLFFPDLGKLRETIRGKAE